MCWVRDPTVPQYDVLPECIGACLGYKNIGFGCVYTGVRALGIPQENPARMVRNPVMMAPIFVPALHSFVVTLPFDF